MSDEKLLEYLYDKTDPIRKQRKKGMRLCTACDNLGAFEELAIGTINRPIQNAQFEKTTKLCLGGLPEAVTEQRMICVPSSIHPVEK